MIIRTEQIVERRDPVREVALALTDGGSVAITVEDTYSIAIVEMTADEVKRLAFVAASFARNKVPA